MKFTVVLKPTEYPDEQGYTVVVPALPGCITEGDTIEEALENAKEAVALYVEGLLEKGLPVPVERERYEAVEVEVPTRS